jgi:hypothetical protein
MFCLLDTTYGGLHEQFQRNGDVDLVTTMCWLLFEPGVSKKWRRSFDYDYVLAAI